MFNKVKAFELALYNGIEPRSGKQLGLQTGDVRDFKSYDELYNAFLKQVEYMVELFTKAWHLAQQIRSELVQMPFACLTVDDCIERGKGFLQGGMKYPWLKGDYADVGHQNVSDEKLRDFYQKSYLLLMPMESCSANNSLVEALACGLPVVTTAIGGIEDYGGG